MVQREQLCKPVLLGEINVPSGKLLILDPGLARFWQHDGDPRSPVKNAPENFDLQIVGPDAIEVGRAFDRQFDPRYLFDIKNVEHLRQHFTDYANGKGKKADLKELPKRISHIERAQLAIEIGEGGGVAQYNGFWAVAVEGLPKDRPLQIIAIPMPEGEFNGRWRSIDIVIDSEAQVAKSFGILGVMVEHGQLLCSDLDAFGEFKMWQSLDGQADYVFWGKDAAAIAEVFHAKAINQREFGWLNLPMDEIGKHASDVQNYIETNQSKVAVDYRPHCNLEKLNSQIRESELEVGQVVLKNAAACGFSNRWGDGIFEVFRDFDASGRLVRVRIDVGSVQRQKQMRRLRRNSLAALVTRKILDEGQRILYAERMEPNNPSDSGWAVSAGTENDAYMEDAKNIAIVSIESLLQLDPELEAILDAPIGSAFRRESKGYVPDA